jgi:uncharacterized Zn finger protein
MDEFGFYPDWVTACPQCGSESTDEVVTYPETSGFWTDGSGGHVDCKCEQCGYEWMRDFGENDIPDLDPIG